MLFRTSLITLASVFSLGHALAGTTSITFDAHSVANEQVQFSGSTSSQGLYTGSGVTVTGLLDPAVYQLSMTFSLDDVSAWRKLVDYQATTDDVGFYINDGHLAVSLWHQFTPSTADVITGSDTITSGQSVTVSISRDASGLVSAYLNNVLQFSFADAYNDAVFVTDGGKSVINLLKDDYISRFEQATGTLQSITLTSARSPDLNLPLAAVPEPESVALASIGLITALGVARTRQRRHQG